MKTFLLGTRPHPDQMLKELIGTSRFPHFSVCSLSLPPLAHQEVLCPLK